MIQRIYNNRRLEHTMNNPLHFSHESRGEEQEEDAQRPIRRPELRPANREMQILESFPTRPCHPVRHTPINNNHLVFSGILSDDVALMTRARARALIPICIRKFVASIRSTRPDNLNPRRALQVTDKTEMRETGDGPSHCLT